MTAVSSRTRAADYHHPLVEDLLNKVGELIAIVGVLDKRPKRALEVMPMRWSVRTRGQRNPLDEFVSILLSASGPGNLRSSCDLLGANPRLCRQLEQLPTGPLFISLRVGHHLLECFDIDHPCSWYSS